MWICRHVFVAYDQNVHAAQVISHKAATFQTPSLAILQALPLLAPVPTIHQPLQREQIVGIRRRLTHHQSRTFIKANKTNELPLSSQRTKLLLYV